MNLVPIFDFIVETEKLKGVERRTCPVGLPRRENSAEHSWSLALAAMTLIPEIDPTMNTLRVIEMLLIHDLVEIDAGDTFAYDDQTGKRESEEKAADRIFGLLPSSSKDKFKSIWYEFEAKKTKESRFANALDRLFPLLQNSKNNGGAWVEHGITVDQVFRRNSDIRIASPILWDYALKIIESAKESGWLKENS